MSKNNPEKKRWFKNYLDILKDTRRQYAQQNWEFSSILEFYSNPNNYTHDKGELAKQALEIWKDKTSGPSELAKFHEKFMAEKKRSV